MKQTLFIGDFRFREFHSTVDCLKSHSWLALAIDVEDAIIRVEKQRLSPDLIVLGQAHPGQFTRAAVERLHRSAPLARLVAVLGSWCESETRTGYPWPGVLRVYWHQFPARMDWAFLQGAAGGPWDLPRTSSDAERILTGSMPAAETAEHRLVVIRACGLIAYQALADALNAAGYATTWTAENQHPFVSGHWAGIWDCGMHEFDGVSELTHFSLCLQPAPVIALKNFPRPQDCRRLLSGGATAVLGKPFAVGDLLGLLGPRSGDRPEATRNAFAA